MKTTPYFFKILPKWRLNVFLCGPKPISEYSDIRKKVKKFLTHKAYVNCFLGEEIIEIILGNDNHLKIESEKAKDSDVIIIFLGSSGTFAELGAFTVDPGIRAKLIVFNDIQFQGKESFINCGPLKWLKDYQVIWYDPHRTLDEHIFHFLYNFLLRIRYSKFQFLSLYPFNKFENYLTYMTLVIFGASDLSDLIRLTSLKDHAIRKSISDLLGSRYIVKVGKQFDCSKLKPTTPAALFRHKIISALRCENLADQY